MSIPPVDAYAIPHENSATRFPNELLKTAAKVALFSCVAFVAIACVSKLIFLPLILSVSTMVSIIAGISVAKYQLTVSDTPGLMAALFRRHILHPLNTFPQRIYAWFPPESYHPERYAQRAYAAHAFSPAGGPMFTPSVPVGAHVPVGGGHTPAYRSPPRGHIPVERGSPAPVGGHVPVGGGHTPAYRSPPRGHIPVERRADVTPPAPVGGHVPVGSRR